MIRALFLVALLVLPLASAEHVLHEYGATLTLDRSVYRSGDKMAISFHNGGEDTLYFFNSRPWEVRDATGQVPFKWNAVTGSPPPEVPSGHTYNMTWNLGGGGGFWRGEIPPGNYTIVVMFGPPSRYAFFDVAREVSAPFRACTTPREGAEGHADRAFLALYCGEPSRPPPSPPDDGVPEARAGGRVALCSDVQLMLISPNGTVYLGNNFEYDSSWSIPAGKLDLRNVFETVRIPEPEVGEWRLRIVAEHRAANVTLMATGEIDHPSLNRAPYDTSTVSGSSSVTGGTYETFSVQSTGDRDEGEPVRVQIHWGDGTPTVLSNEITASPDVPLTLNATHRFIRDGTFLVTARTIDGLGATSPWSAPLAVTVTCTPTSCLTYTGGGGDECDLDDPVLLTKPSSPSGSSETTSGNSATMDSRNTYSFKEVTC